MTYVINDEFTNEFESDMYYIVCHSDKQLEVEEWGLEYEIVTNDSLRDKDMVYLIPKDKELKIFKIEGYEYDMFRRD